MHECIAPSDKLAESHNQFHFRTEEAPVFETVGGQFVIFKKEDPEIPSSPDSLCAIESIVKGEAAMGMLYLNYPCFKCQNRVFVSPAPKKK